MAGFCKTYAITYRGFDGKVDGEWLIEFRDESLKSKTGIPKEFGFCLTTIGKTTFTLKD